MELLSAALAVPLAYLLSLAFSQSQNQVAFLSRDFIPTFEETENSEENFPNIETI